MIGTAPDGGYGWVVVFAAYVCISVVDGICFSFGLYINEFARHFNVSLGIASIPGSIMNAMTLLMGPIVGSLVSNFGSRPVVMVGAAIASFGLLTCVFSKNLIHFCILYGFFGGLGLSLMFLPVIVHIGIYFEERRAIATGIAMGGSGIGTAIIAMLSPILISEFNWQGAQWILATVTIQCVVCGALLRPLQPDRKPSTGRNDVENDNLCIADNIMVANNRENFDHCTNSDLVTPKLHFSSLQNLNLTKMQSKPKSLFGPHLQLDLTMKTKPFWKSDLLYAGSIQSINTIGTSKSLHGERHNLRLLIPLDEVKTQTRKKSVLRTRSICLEMVDFRLLTDPLMVLNVLSSFLACLSMFIPFVYTASRVIGNGATPTQASLLITISGISNTLGRTSVGYIADKTCLTANTITVIGLAACGLLNMVSMLLDNYYLIAIYMGAYGYSIAPFVSLSSIVVVDHFGLDKLNNGFGLVLLSRGISSCMGSPIGGALYDATGSYGVMYCYAGILMLFAAGTALLIPIVSRKRSVQRRIPTIIVISPSESDLIPELKIQK